MILNPINQLELFGLEDKLKNLIKLFDNKTLPNKILFSGQKGIGKSTLAYHLINYALSKNEKFPYDQKNFKINENNKSFILTSNSTNPNFYLIDKAENKNNIDITQIRKLIFSMNKSSFNSKPRFILIDNIEYLNENASNSLLKILEEPNYNIFFLLIKNNTNLLSTIKSRCIEFKIYLSNQKLISTTNKLLNESVENLINKDLMNYYFTPGKYVRLLDFAKTENLDLLNTNLKQFLKICIDKSFFKKNYSIRTIFYEFIELFFIRYSYVAGNNINNSYNYFINKFSYIDKYNLDEQSLLMEFENKFLNE